jgi:hypothetical protein
MRLCSDAVKSKFQNMFWQRSNKPQQCFKTDTVINKHFTMNYAVWNSNGFILFQLQNY